MTINESKKMYGLPNPSTPEDLEMRFSGMSGKMLTYGDKILVAGYHYNGASDKCYFAAIYEFLDEGHDIDDMVGLEEVSGIDFEDDGHAMAWLMDRR